MTMNQPDDRARRLSPRDQERAARFADAEERYDQGLPARDDIDQSLYHEFAAGDRATDLLVKLARDQARADAEACRRSGRAGVRLPDLEAEAG